MIDEKQLAEWKALADAATGGPWTVYDYSSPREPGENGCHIVGHCRKATPHGPAESPARHGGTDFPCGGYDTEVVTTDGGCYTHNEADLDFIATARTAVPALVEEVRRLRGLCACGHAKEDHEPTECKHLDGCCGWVSAVGKE